jgi:hypothetical protein
MLRSRNCIKHSFIRELMPLLPSLSTCSSLRLSLTLSLITPNFLVDGLNWNAAAGPRRRRSKATAADAAMPLLSLKVLASLATPASLSPNILMDSRTHIFNAQDDAEDLQEAVDAAAAASFQWI